ncbi:glycosyl hydrolase [Paraflavisolibacter sp. H34]|uniref:glycosyl hydrolase n=1 Tax=Huijunlia imazamoxiresistens TaxID=3127457 RepID=UPI0030192227
MDRRSFLKKAGTAGLVTLITPTAIVHALRNNPESSLLAAFKNPPPAAKPYTWWHWMNGNVTREGITLDLEALKRVGIGGVQCFNVGAGIPKGPVDYLGTEWVELTKHAISEAGRLGLEFDMHNCPGWSSTGGPWITPELSMQQVVWSETVVKGGQPLSVQLPKPFIKLDFYRDTLVLAYPTLAGEERTLAEMGVKVSSQEGAVDGRLLGSADFSSYVPLRPAGGQGYLLFEFPQPFEARSVAVYSTMPAGTVSPAGASNLLVLEASDDGRSFRKVAEFRRVGNNLEMPATSSFTPVKAKYYRLLATQELQVAGVRLSAAARLPGWTAKANFPGAGGSGNSGVSQAAASLEAVPAASAIDPATVLDLTSYMDKEGKLNWTAPAGNWTVLRFGHTAIGRKNNAAPESGAGLECDKYSRAAYDFHFNKMFENLLPALKELAGKSKVGLLVDSYEVGLQNWTPGMPQEFQKRRGYSFIHYLPALTGRIVGSTDTTERFLWDLRRTHADLMADNYHGYFAELCRRHGILAYTEPYNNGPFDQLEVGSKVDINMGEFWIRGTHFYPSVKLAASIAHVYGQRLGGHQIVGAESFTGDAFHSKWQEHPYVMKAQGDFMYTKGLNRFIFHRYAHQPHPTAFPGMTMGPWGFHFDRTNTWFEKAGPWLQYSARCQSILQQGRFVADLMYFTGEETPGEDISMLGAPDPAPPAGYDFDFVNREALLTRLSIKGGRIVLPDGLSYRLLVLPPVKVMSLEVLRQLHRLVRQGMVLVGPPPERTPGLAGHRNGDAELQRLVHELWGDLEGVKDKSQTVGAGQVFYGMPLQKVLDRLQLKPDFEFTSRSGDAPVNFIHRSVDDSEVYFVANRRRTVEEVVAAFRVTGKKPELWNADTGEVVPVAVYDVRQGRTFIPLQLDPSGSCFVVFREPLPPKRVVSVEKDGKPLVSTYALPVVRPGRFAHVTNNFTIATWIKPETEENFAGSFGRNRGPASNVFYPIEAEKVYGKDHVACGLLAARNGFMVYERGAGSPTNLLTVPLPLSGWTHVALVYRNGAPLLYVDGRLVQEGVASGKIVHPGLREATQDSLSWFFEGDMTEPELFSEVLSADRIGQLKAKGTPLPQGPLPVQPATSGKGGFLFWKNGRYTLRHPSGPATTLPVEGLGQPTELQGSWTVSFPPGLGAPAQVVLPRLASLHRHAEEGVKYFSGTATYTKKFTVPASALAAGRSLFLDLGRVEVMAEVTVNGKPLGMLWKPPFLVDITGAARAGENVLEVQVTNLWPNRLIGDEQLPEENVYGAPTGSGAAGAMGAIKQLPDWYREGRPKPSGGRVTFSTWKHFSKESPLLESGLLGPVLLRSAVQKTV